MSDLPEIPRPRLVATGPGPGPDPLAPLMGMIGSIIPGAGELLDRVSTAAAVAAVRLSHAMDLIERMAADLRAIRVALEERRIEP